MLLLIPTKALKNILFHILLKSTPVTKQALFVVSAFTVGHACFIKHSNTE